MAQSRLQQKLGPEDTAHEGARSRPPFPRQIVPADRLDRDNQNFEALFRVPVIHRLLVVRSRSRGGLWSGVYWEHAEYDPHGLNVARYESFAESNQAGVRRSGWRKYDPAGRLVEEGEWL